MKFLSYCVDVTKVLPNACHDQDPYQTVENEARRLKGTPCDAYAKYPVSDLQLYWTCM